MVGVYVSDEEDKALIEEVVFDRLYWDRLDSGDISDKEVVSAIKTRLPERLWDVSEKIYYSWIYNIIQCINMIDKFMLCIIKPFYKLFFRQFRKYLVTFKRFTIHFITAFFRRNFKNSYKDFL